MPTCWTGSVAGEGYQSRINAILGGNAGARSRVSATPPSAHRGDALRRATAWLILPPSILGRPAPYRRGATLLSWGDSVPEDTPSASCWSEVSITGSSTCSTNAPRAMTGPSRRSMPILRSVPLLPLRPELALDLSGAQRVTVHDLLQSPLPEARGSQAPSAIVARCCEAGDVPGFAERALPLADVAPP